MLHIIIGLEPGGAELMLQRLVLARASSVPLSHEVISLTGVGPVGERLRAAGVPVQALGLKGLADLPRVARALSRAVRANRADVVQTWMYHADLLGGWAARGARRPLFWGVRTTSVGSGNARLTRVLQWLCARLSARWPDAIVCAAEAARTSHSRMGYARRRMVVIPNGFDVLDATRLAACRLRARAQWALCEDDHVVGCAGRFNPDKDFRGFVRAAGRVARIRSNVCFVMFGRGLDAGNPQLSEWIEREGQGARFVLMGETPALADWLAGLDLFVLSSRTEGFPNVVGEAMAAQVPVVATDVGDAARLVGNTGWIVPPEQPEPLACAIADALSDGVVLRARGVAARQRVAEEFSLQRCVDAYAELYADGAAGMITAPPPVSLPSSYNP